MSGTHMEPLAMWGKNSHSVSTEKIIVPSGSDRGSICDYAVFEIPRTMFRQAASMFSDVRHADSQACYDEMALQLFLNMLYLTATLEKDQIPKNVYPYMKVYLEWVPHSTLEGTAVSYRIHAFSFDESIKFGTALDAMLFENNQMSNDSMNRKMNSRKSDPLSGLHPYQKWMRVCNTEMYVRTVCDRYDKSQKYTDKMTELLNPKNRLDLRSNAANPIHVFNIDSAMERTPETADSIFCNRTNYVGEDEEITSVEFPSAKHTILLTPSQLHPKVFCGKYLPDHQRWMEAQKAITQKQFNNGYDENVETEYDIRTPADIERARLEGMYDKSAFAILAKQNKAKYLSDVAPFEHTDEFTQRYKDYQAWAIHAMKTQCLDPDACISNVVSKMLSWRDSNKIIIKNRISDPSLSVFANRTMTLMEGFEQYYLISTAHRNMFLIYHARYDSFRRDFGLHFNCFQAGDSACSKSFTFILMDKASIPGTVEVLTYQTGKADAVDGNRNDITTVCHEAPPGMFRSSKNPNADSTQEAMFKEKLTSQRVTAKIWCQDEGTGKRSARLTKSECIGVWMGATNDPRADVEEALGTRFFWGNFEQQNRKGRDIDDCMNGERMMSPADKARRKRLFEEGKEEQYRMMLVEKSIWCRVVKDVNMTACNILIPRLKATLTKNSIVMPGPRDWERVKIFARLLAIVTAIETVCNLPGGVHYGKIFIEEMIPDLEPYLRVTEEMVIFTLSLLADQFRSPVEHKILHTIYNMEKNAPKFVHPNSDEPCSNYIKLPRLRQLSKKINSRIPLEKGRVSSNNIENFILTMQKHSILSQPYKERAVPPGAHAAEDKFPVENSDAAPTRAQSCVVTNEGVFIHVSHVLAHREDGSDDIFQKLAAETHMHSDEKRIITACPLTNNFFHVFKVIERTPSGAELEYDNVLANTSISRWITNTNAAEALTRTRLGYKIDKDIDKHVAQKWATTIGKGTYTPEEIIEHVESASDWVRPDINYPHCFVYKKRKRTDSSIGQQKRTKSIN
jgi:hypothetical protein